MLHVNQMAQFDWFVILGYWTISHDEDLKLGILCDSRLIKLMKTNNRS